MEKNSIKNNSYEAVIIDGMWIKLWKGNKKHGKKYEKRVAITALGINKDKTEVIDFEIAESESEKNVSKLLRRIYDRGLKPENIDLFITDGAGGIESAMNLVFGNIPLQRCIMHKLGNLRSDLSDMPILRPKIMEQAKNIFNAGSLNSFLKRVDDFKKSLSSLHEKKKNFEKNIEKCGTYFSVGSKYRTTEFIENKFRHLRRLTRVQSHYVNDKSAERYFYGQLLLREYIVPYQNFTQNT